MAVVPFLEGMNGYDRLLMMVGIWSEMIRFGNWRVESYT